MNARPDASEIAELLADRVDDLVPTLFPAATHGARDSRIGDVSGNPGNSLGICRRGPRAGRWQDFAAGTFGDALDLINAAMFGGQDMRRAIEWACDFLRLDPDRPEPTVPAQEARPKRRRHDGDETKIAVARNLWASSTAISGTLGETYLRQHRCVTIPLPPTLRYHPALTHTATGLALPALVAAISGADGKVSGVLRTYLDLRGRKAPVTDPKMSLGCMLDGACRLAPAGSELGLAEGVETALSAIELHGLPVWAACGSRLNAVRVPDSVERLIIFADNGVAGDRAAERAATQHERAGRAVEIKQPRAQFKDWNDAAPARTQKGAA